MTPPTILRQLSRLRWRERSLGFTWGVARWLTLAIALLIVCCAADWFVDRFQDTPYPLRVALLVLQLLVGLTLAVVLVVRPLLSRLTDDELALRIEDRFPNLGHRLITALQLNRAGARREGMSPELIAAVTRDAEEQTARTPVTTVADHRRLQWAGLLTLGAVIVAGGCLLLFPATATALLARQWLADVEVPRSVMLDNATAEVWPSGDEVILRYRVSGPGLELSAVGTAWLLREDGSLERYPLEHERDEPDGTALFVAHVPPSGVPFKHRAYLKDGRTRSLGQVAFEPRPEVVRQEAWTLLPAYVGLRPDGTRYSEPQPKGDVEGYLGSTARVLIEAQKPLREATLELLGPGPEGGPEEVKRTVKLTVADDGSVAQGEFDLTEGETAYRVHLRDRVPVADRDGHEGFVNLLPPRRTLTLLPDAPPQVQFLPERFAIGDGGLTEANEVEGMPVPVGKSVRIAYTARSPLGLAKAQLRYRVNDGPWTVLPLREYRAGEGVGAFDLRSGAFENSGTDAQVEYHAVPSADPDEWPSFREGGGRFDFRTSQIAELKAGDQLEFVVEVFDRNPAAGRTPGQTDPGRIKRVVTDEEFVDWIDQTLQQEKRIRDLADRQRDVFRRSGN